MDARRRKTIKKASLRQEKQTAADIGGRTTANSGAARFSGGADVRGVGLRIECKFTEKNKYILKFSELDKLRKQAIQTLEFPVFQFAFKFRNTFEKYAVTPYSKPAVQGPERVYECLGLSSLTIERDDLRQLLVQNKFLLVYFNDRAFQIQGWDDFLKQFEGPTGFSMGCKVPDETCTICEEMKCKHLGNTDA